MDCVAFNARHLGTCPCRDNPPVEFFNDCLHSKVLPGLPNPSSGCHGRTAPFLTTPHNAELKQCHTPIIDAEPSSQHLSLSIHLRLIGSHARVIQNGGLHYASFLSLSGINRKLCLQPRHPFIFTSTQLLFSRRGEVLR